MKMTWRFPPALAAGLGLPTSPDNIYILSSAEFAGRLTQATGQPFDEDLTETERQYHIMRLANVAAEAVMRREKATQIVMDSGGFQVFDIVELIDEAAGLDWLKALFAVYIEQRFEDPAGIRNKDFDAWARVLSDDEVVSIAAEELRTGAVSGSDEQSSLRWLYMDRAAQIYWALQETLELTEPEPDLEGETEIPLTAPVAELTAAVHGQQFQLPLVPDTVSAATQADGGIYGKQNDI